MIKIFVITNLITWLGLNLTDKQVQIDDNKAYLTGAGSKSWYLYGATPESEGATCKSSHAIARDNTYTFFADGTFEFDHGILTKDEQCENDCCSDMVNLTGTWKFTNRQKGIKITLLHEKGVQEDDLKMVLYNATIDQLDDASLKFSQLDPDTKVKYVFEFRSK